MSELETETQSAVTSGVTEDASSIRERSKIFFAGGLGAGIAIPLFFYFLEPYSVSFTPFVKTWHEPAVWPKIISIVFLLLALHFVFEAVFRRHVEEGVGLAAAVLLVIAMSRGFGGWLLSRLSR